MATTIISRFSELAIRTMPNVLPSSRMKNSGAARSPSAEPIHHNAVMQATNNSRISLK